MGNLSVLIGRGTVQMAADSTTEVLSSAIVLGTLVPENAYQIQLEIPIHTNTIGDVTVNIYNLSKVVATVRNCFLQSYVVTGVNTVVVPYAKNVEGMFVGSENQVKLGMYGSANGDTPLIAFAIFALMSKV